MKVRKIEVQCPLYIATLDIAAALPIATLTAVTNLCQYINSDLGYNDLNFSVFCTKIATVNSFEVAISSGLCFLSTKFYFFEPNVLWKWRPRCLWRPQASWRRPVAICNEHCIHDRILREMFISGAFWCLGSLTCTLSRVFWRPVWNTFETSSKFGRTTS